MGFDSWLMVAEQQSRSDEQMILQKTPAGPGSGMAAPPALIFLSLILSASCFLSL